MHTLKIDPSPRSYPNAVSLIQRSRKGQSCAPQSSTLEETEDWLLGEAMEIDNLLHFYETFVWRLVASNIPLDRASLHIGTLHPQLFGFAWNWERADEICDEVKVDEAILRSDAYRRNPIFSVIEHGKLFQAKTTDPGVTDRYPIMNDLGKQGIIEYLAIPLRSGGEYHNATTIATKQDGGFTEVQLESLSGIFKLLALQVERHILRRVAQNALNTYLGNEAGERVLSGTIRRGEGQHINAIIWASDLRGFTDLVDRLSGAEVTTLLNAYFERLAEAVIDHGGEVLKFIGDGLLAVFPYERFDSKSSAANSALKAATQALKEIDRLNESPGDLDKITGWYPLRTGIALHEGDVFFGNVGAQDRLDFTVIGKAVNAASRIEGLSKSLKQDLLITESVATYIEVPLDALGEHKLRGFSRPVALFSLGRT